MKIMISQPMKNKADWEIKAERKELVDKLEKEGHEVLDTIFDLGDNASPILYLAKSIEYLDKADAVVFMKGWTSAKGCVIEHEVALRYGKYIMELS